MQDRFTSQQVIALTGITPRQLQWWDERGVVKPEREGLDLAKKLRLYAGEAVEGMPETEAVRLILGGAAIPPGMSPMPSGMRSHWTSAQRWRHTFRRRLAAVP